jgi:deoxyribonuclease IV
MLPDGRRIGPHLPHTKGLVKAIERAGRIGASAVQLFGDNPTAWRRRREPSKELVRFRERAAELDIGPIAIHAAYLVNLAGPDEAFFAKSVGILASDLRTAPGFGARFVNVHTGSHRDLGPEAGIERLADGVALVLAEIDDAPGAPQLVLENAAGGGHTVGATVEELAAIADAVARRGIATARLAFCLDTAHLWGAGYDLADPDATDRLLARFDELIGLDRLVMLHLNDSKAERGSRLDRHQHVGAGRIGERGMAHLLTTPALGHVATYIETPGMDDGYDAINLRRAHDLALGRPLEPLPADALTLGGSRARARAHARDRAEATARKEADPRPTPTGRRTTKPRRSGAAA